MPQPLLHHQLVALAAPTQAWSGEDGTMTGAGTHGVFHGDWRYVRGIELRVDGLPVEPLSTAEEHDWAVFRAVALDPEAGQPIHRVSVERMREVTPGGMVERLTLINGRDEPIDALVEIVCDIEIAPMASVRAGRPEPAPITVGLEGDEAIATDGVRTLRASGRGGRVRIDGSRVIVAQQAHVVPDDWHGMALELELIDPTLAVRGSACDAAIGELRPTGRPALDAWGAQAITDLEHLLLDAGHGAFPAAGAPWHLTMVARDALVACRLLLPLGGALAEGTLRTLAARQGVRFDPATGEEPGRILHEMRQGVTDALRPGVEAPPVYSGSIDATPLWIVLLHDAWQAGLPLETVRELRTALHSALAWMQANASEGFLGCPDEPGMALSGKGWRELPEGMRFGSEGAGMAGVVTAQAQGLACRAAVAGAALLDALGDDGEHLRAWAERLRERFREAFWVERRGIRFPAMALDAEGHPFETLVSDIGQLVGTTLLTHVEEAAVARLLLDERLSSGFGLRTMATDAERYWPLAHYCGAVWPHDTAIAIEGLLRAGFGDEARQLAEQLERAADAFGGRMPEVYAGYGLDETPTPIPYPGACSPQAWSAASVVPVHAALIAADAERQPAAPERRLVAVAPQTARSAPEPMEINALAVRRSRAHLHLVPTSAPAP
ncbi:glycogen debranching N-terminal domain-containing protein [Agrococcus baldri]|uniref:Amylo-alpha-1,6-glucosidase n=1 Tax=Agrococcus baldri TaxID=153730 RepID=A0AA87USB1_9MICO|nr:glycogen debranching N-terminal domain-containing protein [Agrococcus baldri]GEK80474.1 amylo-alpha-1,6-glucosidase [Agrococcus baldri]